MTDAKLLSVYEVAKRLNCSTGPCYCHHTWTDTGPRVEQRIPKRIGPA